MSKRYVVKGSLEVYTSLYESIILPHCGALEVTVIAVTAMKVTAMMASFLQVAVAVFEGHLARKLRFHIFNLQFLSLARKFHFPIFNFQFSKEFSHESFVFTSSTIRF